MKCSLLIVEDAQGNLSVPVIDRDKNAVIALVPEVLKPGCKAYFVKNPDSRKFNFKPQQVHPLIQPEASQDELEAEYAGCQEDDVAAQLEPAKRRGRPPKV